MIKNNKGVTLVELLIVIVVMGIIAAFAIPAVGTIIDNTQKDAVLADAIAVENAANMFCAQTTCTATQGLTWAQVSPYVKGIKDTDYDFINTGNASNILYVAEQNGDTWEIYLEGNGNPQLEWTAGDVPSDSDRSSVVEDTD